MESQDMTGQGPHLGAVIRLAQMELSDPQRYARVFKVGPFTAFTMIGAMQMCTRHPELSPDMRARVQQGINHMIKAFEGDPEIHKVLLMGNNPENDVVR